MREDDRYALLIDQRKGYNKFLLERKKSLRDICRNDKHSTLTWNRICVILTKRRKTRRIMWDPGDVAPGQAYRLVLDKPGTYHYHCMHHPYMMGTVIITS